MTHPPVKYRFGQIGTIQPFSADFLTIRRAAAASLSLIGPEARAALPSLRQLEHDPDELLRVWVRAALQAIGDWPQADGERT